MSSLMVLSKNIPWASASLLSIVMAATIGIVGAHGVFAQSRLPPDSAFAVASVKVSKATDFRREEIKFLPGGRVVAGVRNGCVPIDTISRQKLTASPFRPGFLPR
jgi:hypothetical protein